jgi:hypothetical protein
MTILLVALTILLSAYFLNQLRHGHNKVEELQPIPIKVDHQSPG